jgi:hypothetical protein
MIIQHKYKLHTYYLVEKVEFDDLPHQSEHQPFLTLPMEQKVIKKTNCKMI